MRTVAAGAVCTLQPSIATHADAHGAVFETVVGGHRMWVLLPDGPNDDWDLQPPDSMDARLLSAVSGRLGMSPWGYVTRPNTGESWVRRFVVEFDEAVPRMPMADALVRWGRMLSLWIEVWTRQTLDEYRVPKMGPMAAMGILHLDEQGVASPGAYLMQAVIEAQDQVELAAFRADWEKAVDLAARGVDPPTEYRLLRDAEMYLRRGEQRLAVLNAGTAVELAITPPLDARGVKTHDLALGGLVAAAERQGLLSSAGVTRAHVKATLIDVRNAAAHRAVVPTTSEAIAAIDLSDGLVRHYAPLVPHLARPS